MANIEKTQEVSVQFNQNILEMAVSNLEKKTEISQVNLCFRNWDVEKEKEFEKSVFLGVRTMQLVDEKTGEEKELETALFMTSDKQVRYKAAYQFVKAVKMLPVGAMFFVKFLGLEKLGNGNKAETFEVKLHNLV